MNRTTWFRVAWQNRVLLLCLITGSATCGAEEPAPVNPFGKNAKVREDARPGYVELSDGHIVPGSVYLTRDARLRIYDETLKRHRDVPLEAIRSIECEVGKEWQEKEWRFKEAASDEKVFTGRKYPSREYLHTITLNDGRTITGPLSAIVYVQPDDDHKAERFLLHKRDKGELDQPLKSLRYVRKIELGDEALAEGKRKSERRARPQTRTEQPE